MAFSAHKDPKAIQEHYDNEDDFMNKVRQVGELVKASKHTVIFTGAGISTDAGIPDFRGPKGVWTCKAQGVEAPRGVSTISAVPTKTHMSIVKLLKVGKLHYVISQNCDGLHRRSGVPADKISELHGNGNIEYCEDCGFEYLRDFSAYRITRSSDHYTGRHCVNTNPKTGEKCDGRLLESTIDFGQNLPVKPLELAYQNSMKATLHIALGSSLTVSPACTMPKRTAKNNGKLVICNLQNTPLDHLSSIRIYQRCDVFMTALMNYLQISIPEFKLHRRFKLSVGAPHSKTQETEILFAGVEQGTHGREIPASLFKAFEIFNSSFNKRVVMQNTDQRPSAIIKLPSSENVSFRVHTMQHYAEPPLEFTVSKDMVIPGLVSYLQFKYAPSTGIWSTKKGTEGYKVGIQRLSNQNEVLPLTAVKVKVANENLVKGDRFWSTLSPITDSSGNFGLILAGSSSKNASGLVLFQKNTWTALPPIIIANRGSVAENNPKKLAFIDVPRWGHAACSVENRYVFFFGGWDSTYQYNDMHLFDAHQLTFEELETSGQCPSSRAGASLTLAYQLEKMFLFGGSVCKGGDYEFFNQLYAYHPTDHSWSLLETKGDVPAPRSQHSAVLVGETKLLIIGGFNTDTILNDVHLLDLESLVWKKVRTTGPAPPSKRVGAKPFRVYPAQHAALSMSPFSKNVIVYIGETGAFYLDIDSWVWSSVPWGNAEKITGPLGLPVSETMSVLFDPADGDVYMLKV